MRYQAYLAASVERWKEYRDQLPPLGRKPLLFVMMNDTAEADGASHLIETKGLEDVNVAGKDRAARLWCENATALTGRPWSYLKVPQAEYGKLQPSRLAEVVFLAESGGRPA